MPSHVDWAVEAFNDMEAKMPRGLEARPSKLPQYIDIVHHTSNRAGIISSVHHSGWSAFREGWRACRKACDIEKIHERNNPTPVKTYHVVDQGE